MKINLRTGPRGLAESLRVRRVRTQAGKPAPLIALVLLVIAAFSGLSRSTAAPAPAPVGGSDKQLVLDRRVIQAVEGAQLVPGTVEKEARNPLFPADRPWENSFNNLYPNIDFDPAAGTFQLWYKCVLPDKDVIAKMEPPATIHDVGWFLLYATSKDGLAWTKPELDRFGFDGSTKNNVTARDTANVGVFRDPADRDPARRYKMVYDVGFDQPRVRFSADGIRWSEPQEPTGLRSPLGKVADTHNNAFRDPRTGKYVLITRIFAGERLVARSESRDFLQWEEPKVIVRSTPEEGKGRQTYCMPAFPYENVYLGYVMMYNVGKDRTVDCELAWSPDSVRWERIAPGTPFIPRGPAGSYDAGCIYAQAGSPVVRDGKHWIYYGGSTATHLGWKRHCLPCVARLRLDGFAGYEPVEPGGTATVTTEPLRCTGAPLRATADARGGRVRVAVLDAPGWEGEWSAPLSADVTDSEVRWPGGKSFAALKGKPVRLRFEIQGARLYAFRGLTQLGP